MAVNDISCEILNAYSISIVCDSEGTTKTTYSSIVDFSDIAHIDVVNKSIDSAAGHALQRGLHLVQDCWPGSLFYLSRD